MTGTDLAIAGVFRSTTSGNPARNFLYIYIYIFFIFIFLLVQTQDKRNSSRLNKETKVTSRTRTFFCQLIKHRFSSRAVCQ